MIGSKPLGQNWLRNTVIASIVCGGIICCVWLGASVLVRSNFGRSFFLRPESQADTNGIPSLRIDSRTRVSHHWRKPLLLRKRPSPPLAAVTGPRCLSNGFRTPIAKAWIAREFSSGLCRLDIGLGAFGNQCPLQLGDSAENLQRKHDLRGRGIDRSCSERKCAPLSSSCSMTRSRWLTDRARRSSRTTTRISRKSLARIGRVRDAPEPYSSKIS
jgi:hypothetical protein